MPTPAGPATRDRSALVLVVSGACGYLAGRYWFVDWQVAVETAQVFAGLVTYPPDNPFFIYHVKLWTMLHQALAAGLAIGMTERTLSEILSGLMGMASFQALALFVYAISRDGVLSLATIPLVIASRAADFGVVYPIFLTGTVHTYGALGLSLVVLTAALLGCGRNGPGLFLLGVTPAVHPALGAWLVLLAGGAAVLDVGDTRMRLRQHWKPLAAGALVTAVSLALHMVTMERPPALPADDAARYQAAFTALWDIHRQPITFDHPGVRLNLVVLALSSVWLIAFRGDLPRPARFLLRFVAVASAAGLAGVLVSWAPPGRLPSWLITLMPGRVLNVAALTCAPLILGLAGLYLRARWAALLAPLTALALVLSSSSLVWPWVRERGWAGWPSPIDSYGVLLVAAAAVVAGRAALGGAPARDGSPSARASRLVGRTAVAALALAVTWNAARPLPPRHSPALVDRRTDIALAAAAAGDGVLLTGGDLYLIQLLTRRPVLVNGGALDTMAYAIDSAPAMVRILDEVYGIDFFDPPQEARRTSVIPPRHNLEHWRGYTSDRWKTLGAAFGVTQVLTPAHWDLQLPVAAQSRRYLLYTIPE